MSSEQSAEQPSEETAEVREDWRDVELAWARGQLQAQTDGPEAVWRSLQDCGFLPDAAQTAALEILAGTAASPETEVYRRLARREALQRKSTPLRVASLSIRRRNGRRPGGNCGSGAGSFRG